jgi:hypothetical protein
VMLNAQVARVAPRDPAAAGRRESARPATSRCSPAPRSSISNRVETRGHCASPATGSRVPITARHRASCSSRHAPAQRNRLLDHMQYKGLYAEHDHVANQPRGGSWPASARRVSARQEEFSTGSSASRCRCSRANAQRVRRLGRRAGAGVALSDRNAAHRRSRRSGAGARRSANRSDIFRTGASRKPSPAIDTASPAAARETARKSPQPVAARKRAASDGPARDGDGPPDVISRRRPRSAARRNLAPCTSAHGRARLAHRDAFSSETGAGLGGPKRARARARSVLVGTARRDRAPPPGRVRSTISGCASPIRPTIRSSSARRVALARRAKSAR